MSRIIPVPTTRTNDVLTRSRLLSQLQLDQRQLLELQTRISSGRRLVSPSDDATSSLRAIQLQRLLERKQQSAERLNSSRTFLTATEMAAANVSDVLISIRGEVVGAVGTTATDEHRETVADQVGRAMESLLLAANQRFRGRHLFAGSTDTAKPFTADGGYVSYRGNAEDLPSFADVGFLYLSNVSGHEAFGSISSEIRGQADLNPIVTLDTRLDNLHGGLGITRGSFAISDGNSSSVVDINGAETLGDVIDLIEHNPPDGRTVIARLTDSGLQFELDSAGGGNLNVQELAGGRTASDLGILETLGVGSGTLVGGDLAPRLTLTTPLDNILGTHAIGVLTFPGQNNDLVIETTQSGASFNDITIQFVDSGTVTKGNETAVYDVSNPSNKTLTFDIDSGNTRANDVVNALQADPVVNALFSIRLDGKDTGMVTNVGTGTVDTSATALTTGGSGKDFDRTSGLEIVNRGQIYTIDFSAAETLEDVFNALRLSEAGVVATINANGSGIDVRSIVSGADFHIGENGGFTATELGIRSLDAATRLAGMNHGFGVETMDGTDFFIHRKDGMDLAIDLSGARTVGNVLDLINDHVDNQDPATAVVAQLTSQGNGIELVDANSTGTDSLTILRESPSQAVWQLGLISEGADQNIASPGTPEVITGTDKNPIETHGAFNTLIRLEQALRDNDLPAIEWLSGELDKDLDRINFTRAEIGARDQSLDVLSRRLGQENIELQRVLSNEIDADLIESITELSARQASLQASLQVVAKAVRLSLLDFL